MYSPVLIVGGGGYLTKNGGLGNLYKKLYKFRKKWKKRKIARIIISLITSVHTWGIITFQSCLRFYVD